MTASRWMVLPGGDDGRGRKGVLDAVAQLSEEQRAALAQIRARLAIDPLMPGVISGDPRKLGVVLTTVEYDTETLGVTAVADGLTVVCRAFPATGIVRIVYVIAGP
ncbi:hypothetical protein [Streptomyces sp. NPDC056549]|uniref:hypothetical protein n=1 Tax=Streptomyces sp. NPDC056549 TaxID=3345864 RepID=UPI0036B782CD